MKFVKLTVNALSRESLIKALIEISRLIGEGETEGVGGNCKWWIDEVEEKSG